MTLSMKLGRNISPPHTVHFPSCLVEIVLTGISEISFLFQILISCEMKPAEYVLSFLFGLKFREIFFSLWWYRTICTVERRARIMELMRQPITKSKERANGTIHRSDFYGVTVSES